MRPAARSTAQLEPAAKARAWILVQHGTSRRDVAHAFLRAVSPFLATSRRHSCRRSCPTTEATFTWLCLPRPVLLGPLDKAPPNSFFSPFQRAFDPPRLPPRQRQETNKSVLKTAVLPRFFPMGNPSPKFKPLKTKALSDDINTRRPNCGVFSRDPVKICRILQFCKETLYVNRQPLLFQSLHSGHRRPASPHPATLDSWPRLEASHPQ